MSTAKALPPRAKVPQVDQWDLTPLFKSDAAWEAAFNGWQKLVEEISQFKGRLGESAKTLAEALAFDSQLDRAGDKLYVYAALKAAGDQGDSDAQRRRGRLQAASTKAAALGSFYRPEIMAIPPKKMDKFLSDPVLVDWKLSLQRTLRYRKHTLGKKEENLLAMQGQMASAASSAFRQLNDADLKWPMIKNEKGERVELGHSSFSVFLHSPKRAVRKEAFHAYYAQFEAHANTMTATLNGSNQRDAYYAKARGYPSALEASLYHDNMPTRVYDSLVNSVHSHLPDLHRYYALRKRAMKLPNIHAYDTYVPILADLDKRHTWDQAVKVVVESLAPLGSQYTQALHTGLTKGRWCDRYPNAGKQSGAFSFGTFDGPPYIMMNYQPDVLDHVFTLAHEAGHSMHSWYSVRNQPYQYYGYTIFVAEVASTFNEQLLSRHLMQKAGSNKRERAYLINRQIDRIRGTIIRQTMFAEFERITHTLVESGEPLTVQGLRSMYRTLLERYFGPDFVIDPQLELECLRIPHFYNAFYVYKYATGLSAAIALSERVTNGGKTELNDYLNFLKGGRSKFPLDLLRDAGVDMETPGPVDAALGLFKTLVDELDRLL